MKKKRIVVTSLIILIILAVVALVFYYKKNEEKKDYAIEEITEYSYFIVKENEKYGVINRNGDKVIENKYDNVKIPNPTQAVFFCYEGEMTKVLNEKGEEILKEFNNIEPLRLKNVSGDLVYEKSVLKYEIDGKWGLIEK